MIKRAFTMIELVFVIVVIGILSAVLIPRMERDTLREAALQVASHIRYTQHLAMVDDKYVPEPALSEESLTNIACKENTLSRRECNSRYWYQGRWQIHFANTEGSGNQWSYMIYSDGVAYTGTPDILEHARNPLDSSKFLSGGYSAGNIDNNSPLATKEMNLGSKFGVVDVDFIDGCSIAVTRQRIFFDHIGRPFYGAPHLQTSAYHDETNVKLLQTPCVIELCETTCTSASNQQKVQIQIEPETGYVHILD